MGALLVPTYKESFRPPQFFIQCTWLTIYLCFIVVCLSCIFIHKYLCVCVCLRAHECMCGCVCMRHGCVWVGLEFNLGRFITEYKFQQLGSNGKTFNLSNKNILNAPKGFPILLLTLKSSLSIGQCPMTMSPFWYKYSLLAWKSAEAVLNITFMRHFSPFFFLCDTFQVWQLGRHDFPRHLVLIPANERELPLLRQPHSWNSNQRWNFQLHFHHLASVAFSIKHKFRQWQIFYKEKCSIWALDYMGVSLNVCKWQRE